MQESRFHTVPLIYKVKCVVKDDLSNNNNIFFIYTDTARLKSLSMNDFFPIKIGEELKVLEFCIILKHKLVLLMYI